MKSLLKKMSIAKPSPKNVAWMGGGIAISCVFAVGAQIASGVSSSDGPGCDVQKAAQDAYNSKVKFLADNQTDPSKFFQVGGPDSCIGDIANTNVDLSKLIPDLGGFIGGGVSDAIGKLQGSSMRKSCPTSGSTLSSMFSQLNKSIGSLGGIAGSFIDQKTIDSAANMAGSFGVDFNKAPIDLLSSVSLPQAGSSSASPSSYSPSSGQVNLLPQNGANAGGLTQQAVNVEFARANLEAAIARANSADELNQDAAKSAVQAAQTAYDQSKNQLSVLQQQVNGAPVVQSGAASLARPVAPASVGSSVFGVGQ